MTTGRLEVLDPITAEDEKKVLSSAQKWTDEFAAKIAKADFNTAENYRINAHDWRWRAADELYLSWMPQKYWEGSRIPRSSLAVYLVFEHVEALMPRVMSELFSEPTWFEAGPNPGTSPAQARAVRDVILAQMDYSNNGHPAFKEQYRRVAKSKLIYGNGIMELCQENYSIPTLVSVPVDIPIMQPFPDPITGRMIPRPTGKVRRVMQQKVLSRDVNRPYAKYVSLKDFFIDPNTPGPCVQEARYACKRQFVPIDELDRLRTDPRFKIPPKEILIEMAQNKTSSTADSSKSAAESYRMGWWNPADDTSADPASKRIEIVYCWYRDRHVWLANRDTLIHNGPNPYGFIPFYNDFYADVLDRFYSLGLGDVLEGEQRFQEGVINARVDELALKIRKPRVRKRGVTVTFGSLSVRPGQMLEAESPKDDIIELEQGAPVTSQAFEEVHASEIRAQKRDGVSDLAVLGTPSSGGNSANRTATGVKAQGDASSSRARYQVEVAEVNVIEPILTDWHSLNRIFGRPEDFAAILGPEGAQLLETDPTAITYSDVRFSMRASSRMKARSSMLQIMPFLFQHLLNPQLLDQLAKQQGKTLNIDELYQMLLDTVDFKPKSALFRQLTEEEQQALNQPPIEETNKREMQTERLQSQQQVASQKMIADIVKEVIKQLGSKDEDDKPKPKPKAKVK